MSLTPSTPRIIPTPLATPDATQPHEDQRGVGLAGSPSGSCNFQRVPAAKRLVIQEFDASGQLVTGVKPISIYVVANRIGHLFPATLMGIEAGLDYFATHQGTRLYAGPNQVPTCNVSITSVSNPGVYL